MQLKFFCPHWGSRHLSFEDFIKKVKSAGFDGVEMNLPLEKEARSLMQDCIKDHELLLIAQHWETVDADFIVHKKNYMQRLHNLVECQPLFINSQTGRDYFSFEQNRELIEEAGSLSALSGIQIIHETHRARFNFAAHITKRYLDAGPRVRLTLDISHWLVVADSFLQDQQEAIEKAIERTDHIHARVGFPGGPQIPDPRAPEWSDALAFHIKIWERIIDRATQQNRKEFTITPEFGPYPYMTIMPFTQQPIADQWEVNVYMMELLKKQFSALTAESIRTGKN